MAVKKFTEYVSEFTLFMRELKSKNPDIEKNQQSGRARLWDKEPISLDEQKRVLESRVMQKAYVYLTNFDNAKDK